MILRYCLLIRFIASCHVAAAVFTVLAGGLAGQGAELAVEVGLAGKAAFPGDGGDAAVCGVELPAGVCDADFVEDGCEGFSGMLPEVAAQGAGVHAGVSCDGCKGQGFTIPVLEVLHDLVDDAGVFVEPVFSDVLGGDGSGRGSCECVEDVEQDAYSGDATRAGELPDFFQDVRALFRCLKAQAAGAFLQHGCDGGVFGDNGHVCGKERG